MADGTTHYYYLKKGWILIFPLGILVLFIAYNIGANYFYTYPILLYFNYWLCKFQDMDDDQVGITESEGRLMRDTKKVNILFGLFGAWLTGKKMIYAYIIGLFGGHRSKASHGIPFGVIGRMIFYNSILFSSLYNLFGYGAMYWGWKNIYMELYMDVWVIPYLITQYISWQIADIIHYILDTEWAKGNLYIPLKSRAAENTVKKNPVGTGRHRVKLSRK